MVADWRIVLLLALMPLMQMWPDEPAKPEPCVTVTTFVTMERWQNHRLDRLEWQFLHPGPHRDRPWREVLEIGDRWAVLP